MADPRDRRRPPPRRAAALFVSGASGDIPFCRTRDLSLTGLFLETNARPALGSVHEISLAWGDDLFTCRAKVVRHAADGVGICFVEADSLFNEAVQEIMDVSPPLDVTPIKQ